MPFATAEDVATRVARDLTAEEGAQVDLLLELATAVVATAADKDDAWAEALTPVPTILKAYTVELVFRAFSNPQGLASFSEQLGQYSTTQRFRDASSGGMLLSDLEERVIRRAVFGTTTGSAKVESVVHDLYPCLGS